MHDGFAPVPAAGVYDPDAALRSWAPPTTSTSAYTTLPPKKQASTTFATILGEEQAERSFPTDSSVVPLQARSAPRSDGFEEVPVSGWSRTRGDRVPSLPPPVTAGRPGRRDGGSEAETVTPAEERILGMTQSTRTTLLLALLNLTGVALLAAGFCGVALSARASKDAPAAPPPA
jgi:hypothetical protein